VRTTVVFFGLTFAATWTLWIAVAMSAGGTLSPAGGLPIVWNMLFLVGVVAPALVALALSAWENGRVGVRALVGGIARGPSSARWYVFAIGYFAAMRLTAAGLHRIIAGVWPPFGDTSLFVMLGGIVLSTPVQAGEEIGWRAYALPRLTSRIGLGPASVVVGMVWAFWHLPLFFIPGSTTSGQSFPAYLIAVTALSVAMGWLYWRTGGSLFLTMLMHAAVNNTRDIVPSAGSSTDDPFAFSASTLSWLTAAVLWVAAAYFLVRMRSATAVDLSPKRYAPDIAHSTRSFP
jgi:uncharacterized protein